jgi:aspartate kinase
MNDSSGLNSELPAQPGVVVMKFGGTSVEDAYAIRRLVRIVRSRLNFPAVVVVSALAKVTDALLTMGRSAADGETWEESLTGLQHRHEQLASDLLSDEECLGFRSDTSADFAALRALLAVIAGTSQMNPQVQDQLLGFGECLSSKLIAAALRHQGVAVKLVDARCCVVTDSCHTQASPLWAETNQKIRQTLGPIIQARLVPVFGGFVGATQGGIPTTLGRGGSDFSATIVGAALDACRVEIWTDVDGVMSADPRLCPDARLIRKMSFEEAAELAHFGAKVLHPATLVPVAKKNIPVYVLNSRNPDVEGTEIVAHCRGGSPVRAVTAKRSIAAVEIASLSGVDSELLQDVHAAFDRHQCRVEVMSWSHGKVSLLVSSTAALAGVVAELESKVSLRWENHKALICLVGGKYPALSRDCEPGVCGGFGYRGSRGLPECVRA